MKLIVLIYAYRFVPLVYSSSIAHALCLTLRRKSLLTNFTNFTNFIGKPMSNASTLKLAAAVAALSLANDTRAPAQPTVLAWGFNGTGLIARDGPPAIKTPTEIAHFRGKLLRDLHIGKQAAVAVLDNGNVVQWDAQTGFRATLTNHSICKAALAENKRHVYALASSGRALYSWTTDDDALRTSGWLWTTKQPSSLSALALPKLAFREYITDMCHGDDHLLLLTSKGRVLSGSLGSDTPARSHGQYGIARYSHFDSAPAPGTLHHVKLLQNIDQIAAGAYHSLAKDRGGQVFGFGENIHGQLGRPYAPKNEFLSVPTLINLPRLVGDKAAVATGIWAGGQTSYIEVLGAAHVYRLFALGSGLSGQHGTGSFAHAQSSPLLIKALSDVTEFSEKYHTLVGLRVSQLAVGPTHTAAVLARDLLTWGANQDGQLGNGKKNTVSQPRPVDWQETQRLQLADNGRFRQVVALGDSTSFIYCKRT